MANEAALRVTFMNGNNNHHIKAAAASSSALSASSAAVSSGALASAVSAASSASPSPRLTNTRNTSMDLRVTATNTQYSNTKRTKKTNKIRGNFLAAASAAATAAAATTKSAQPPPQRQRRQRQHTGHAMLLLRNLPAGISGKDIVMDLFADCSDIISANPFADPNGGPPYAEVTFGHQAVALAALQAHSGQVYRGCKLKIAHVASLEPEPSAAEIRAEAAQITQQLDANPQPQYPPQPETGAPQHQPQLQQEEEEEPPVARLHNVSMRPLSRKRSISRSTSASASEDAAPVLKKHPKKKQKRTQPQPEPEPDLDLPVPKKQLYSKTLTKKKRPLSAVVDSPSPPPPPSSSSPAAIPKAPKPVVRFLKNTTVSAGVSRVKPADLHTNVANRTTATKAPAAVRHTQFNVTLNTPLMAKSKPAKHEITVPSVLDQPLLSKRSMFPSPEHLMTKATTNRIRKAHKAADTAADAGRRASPSIVRPFMTAHSSSGTTTARKPTKLRLSKSRGTASSSASAAIRVTVPRDAVPDRSARTSYRSGRNRHREY